MRKKDIQKISIIYQLIDGYITVNNAAIALDLFARQVKRLKKGVMEKGPEALIHKNRGRSPVNAIPPHIKQEIIKLASTVYQGFNYHHIKDLLYFQHNIDISVSSVRRILLKPQSQKKKT